MISTKDITRLRSESGDDSVFNYAYKQDTSFKDAVDRIRTAHPNMNELDAARFPTAIINRHYFNKWDVDETPSSPMTTQAATAAMESFSPQPRYTLSGFVGNTLSSGANFIGGMAHAVAHPIETAENIGKLAIGGAANTVETVASAVTGKDQEGMFNAPGEDLASRVGQFYKERYGGIQNAIDTMYKDPVGFLADAATVLSLGAGAAKGISTIAQLGKTSVPLESVAATTGRLGESLAGAASTIDPAMNIGKVGMAAGKTLVKGLAPESLVAKAMGISTTDAKNILKENVAGVSPEEWLLKNKIISMKGDTPESVLQKLEQSATASKSQVDAALKGIKTTYGAVGDDAAKASAMTRVSQALDTLETLYKDRPGLEKPLSEIAKFKGKVANGVLTLEDVNSVKRLLDDADLIYSKAADVQSSVAAKGLSVVRDEIKTFIEKEAKANGVPQVAEWNKNTQVAKAIEKAIKSASVRMDRKSTLSLTDYITGGIGSSFGGAVGGIGLVVGKKLLENPRFRTALASVLSRLDPTEFAILSKIKGVPTEEVMQIIKRVVAEAKGIAEAPATIEAGVLPERLPTQSNP